MIYLYIWLIGVLVWVYPFKKLSEDSRQTQLENGVEWSDWAYYSAATITVIIWPIILMILVVATVKELVKR